MVKNLPYRWECKLVQPLWITVWRVLKKLKIELPYDPAVLLLGIYPEKKNMIQKDICTPVFTAALFTITKTREQAKCPLTEEWIKMWYMYTMEYYSAIKKNEITSCAAIWRDLESVILVKSDREGGILYNIPYKWNLKRNDTNELTYKTGRDLQT